MFIRPVVISLTITSIVYTRFTICKFFRGDRGPAQITARQAIGILRVNMFMFYFKFRRFLIHIHNYPVITSELRHAKVDGPQKNVHKI